jgi:hypothetical protein
MAEILKRDDKKSAEIKTTLTKLSALTQLPWTLSQLRQDGPYFYALEDAHIPLAHRLDWEAYQHFAERVNARLNADVELVAAFRGRRDIFPLGDGLRFATVGGSLYNGRRIGVSLLLSAALEDPRALAGLAQAELKDVSAPIRAMFKASAAESELHKNLSSRMDPKLV